MVAKMGKRRRPRSPLPILEIDGEVQAAAGQRSRQNGTDANLHLLELILFLSR